MTSSRRRGLLLASTASTVLAGLVATVFAPPPAAASAGLAPVTACPAPLFGTSGQTPSQVAKAVALPFALPIGSAVFGAGLVPNPRYLVGPAVFSCTSLEAADGGEVVQLSGPSGSSTEIAATFDGGGAGPATDLACPYIPAVKAVDVAFRGKSAPCNRPAGELITPLSPGLDTTGKIITDRFVALVQVPAGVKDPSLPGSGAGLPTAALITATVRNDLGTTLAYGQSIECTLPPADGASCAASLGYFLYQSYVATGAVAGTAMADPAPLVSEIYKILVAGAATSWSSSLPTPGQALSNAGRVASSAAIAAAGTLFITFPAHLFNLTFDENYGAIRGWTERQRRRVRGLVRRASDPDNIPAGEGEPAPAASTRRGAVVIDRRTRTGLLLVVGLGALLGSLLDPSFGFSWGSLDHYLAVALALVAGLAGTIYTLHLYRRRRGWVTDIRLRALPLGLVVAVGCVAFSRFVDFRPGYLYGVVAGAALAKELADEEKGQVTALVVAASLVLSVLAWLLWVPVHAATGPGAFFVGRIVDDFLAALFVAGLVGASISLLPIRFLPGHTIMRWSRWAWAALFAGALFGVIDILLRSPVSPGAHHSPLVTTIVLLVVFAGASIAFREHFARKWRAAHRVEVHGLVEWARDLIEARPSPDSEPATPVGPGDIVLEDADRER